MEQLIKDIEQYLSVTQQDDWYIRSKLKSIKEIYDNRNN